MTNYYTIEMFAVLCNVDDQTVRTWIQSRELKSARDIYTGATLISENNAVKFLDSHKEFSKQFDERMKTPEYAAALYRSCVSTCNAIRAMEVLHEKQLAQLGSNLNFHTGSRSRYYAEKGA